jgi:hypothetical protein
MSPILMRQRREQLSRQHSQVLRYVEHAKLTLLIPIDMAVIWRLIVIGEVRGISDELLARWESAIRSEARADWGAGTLVRFDRLKMTVTFSHIDGRKLSYPHTNGGENVTNKRGA